MKLSKLTPLFLLLTAATTVQANTLTVGAAVATSTELYKGYGTKVVPLPIINYQYDRFFIRGLTAGYKLVDTSEHELAATAYYYMLRFKPGDSDYWSMQQLDKRRSTLMAGLNYTYIQPWGNLHANLSGDVLGNSNAILFDSAYRYPIAMSTQVKVIPAVGAVWFNSKHNNYYFGIEQHESARSGLNAYHAGSSWSPYLEVNTHYQINTSWSTYVLGRASSLSSKVSDSPMVSKDYNLIMSLGVNYRF